MTKTVPPKATKIRPRQRKSNSAMDSLQVRQSRAITRIRNLEKRVNFLETMIDSLIIELTPIIGTRKPEEWSKARGQGTDHPQSDSPE